MCNGLDDTKRHLHYSSASRAVAIRLAGLTGLETGDILNIACSIGLAAMCDNLVDDCKSEAVFIDGHQFARLMSTKEMTSATVGDLHREHAAWLRDPIKPMRLIQDELPF
jgi:hypothetical protein